MSTSSGSKLVAKISAIPSTYLAETGRRNTGTVEAPREVEMDSGFKNLKN